MYVLDLDYVNDWIDFDFILSLVLSLRHLLSISHISIINPVLDSLVTATVSIKD